MCQVLKTQPNQAWPGHTQVRRAKDRVSEEPQWPGAQRACISRREPPSTSGISPSLQNGRLPLSPNLGLGRFQYPAPDSCHHLCGLGCPGSTLGRQDTCIHAEHALSLHRQAPQPRPWGSDPRPVSSLQISGHSAHGSCLVTCPSAEMGDRVKGGGPKQEDGTRVVEGTALPAASVDR